MRTMHTMSLLLSMLVGLLLGLVAWGFLRAWAHQAGDTLMGTHDEVLLGLAALAGFGLGAFLTYILLS